MGTLILETSHCRHFFIKSHKIVMSLLKQFPLGDSITILRPATKNDCIEIKRLIQELADYEKMPNGPKIDHKVLEEDGFGTKQPFFKCIVAQKTYTGGSRELVGFVLFFWTYSTWEGRSIYMEDLYVTPSARGKGVGKSLWQACVKAGLEMGCTRCNFEVLDWNSPSIDFYKSQGAIDRTGTEGWLSFRMNHQEMKKFCSSDSSIKYYE